MTKIDLEDFFTYDPDTGIIYHNPDRPRDDFKSEGGYQRWLKVYGGKEAGHTSSNGYVRVFVNGKGLLAHRVALVMSGIVIPDGYEVDHLDGSRKNNKLNNLRVVTRAENNKNVTVRKDNKSGVTGVQWNKHTKKWLAVIWVDKKSVYLGSFINLGDAAKARADAERKYGFHPNHGKPNL